MDVPRIDFDNLPVAKTLVLVLGVFIFGFFVDHDTFIRWGGLFFGTSVLFWYFLDQSRRYLASRAFWLLTGLIFLVHVSGFVLLLNSVGDWKLMWFMLMVPELPAFFYMRNHLLARS